MTLDPSREKIYVADSGNKMIRVLGIRTGKVETVAGNGEPGLKDGPRLEASFDNPQDVLFYENDNENLLIVADTDNHAIRSIGMVTHNVSTMAGRDKGFQNGIRYNAKFYHPTSLALDSYRDILYISDHYNHAIRKLDIKTGRVTTLSGGRTNGFKSGHITKALFHYPEGIAFDDELEVLYITEFENHAVRAVSKHGIVTLIAGGSPGNNDGVGQLARFYHPTRLAFDQNEKTLYVTDQYNHLIRSVSSKGSSAVDPKHSVIHKIHRSIDTYGLAVLPIFGAIFMFAGAFCFRPIISKCIALRNRNIKYS